MRRLHGSLLSSSAVGLLFGSGLLFGAAVVGVPGPAKAVGSEPATRAPGNPTALPAGALRLAAADNPCNPCAPIKKKKKNPCAAANPCNPCAPANPCAAKNPCAAANPCAPANPCAAANPCNPCAPANPCAAAEAGELNEAGAREIYEGLMAKMREAYGASGDPVATDYQGWPRFSTAPYRSATHGNRYVQNYADPKAAGAYGKYEEVDRIPTGGIVAKDSFVVKPDGSVTLGPLFVMEKLAAGSSPDTADWKYTLIMPDGRTMSGDQTRFCAECHQLAAETDSLYFLPEGYRVSR